MWVALLKVFGGLWVIGWSLVFVASIVMTAVRDGFVAMLLMISPVNIVNWILAFIVLVPGLAALVWAIDKGKEGQSDNPE